MRVCWRCWRGFRIHASCGMSGTRSPTVLAVAACAVLAGCRSFAAMSEWAANASEQVLAALQVHAVSSESCIRRTLQRVDGDELDGAIGQWAMAPTVPAAGRRRVVAVILHDRQPQRACSTSAQPQDHRRD